MKESKCSMCGENEPRHVLARLKDTNDQWRVCDDCATAMLHKTKLVGIWRRIGDFVTSSLEPPLLNSTAGLNPGELR